MLQIELLQSRLESLREEKHQLFQQLKTVLHEEDERKRQKELEQKQQCVAFVIWSWYCIVGNFCEWFIFTFFVSRELFTKIEPRNFFVHGEQMTFQAGSTSNFLALLTPIEACQ